MDMGRLSIAQVVGEATSEEWSQVMVVPAGLIRDEVAIDEGGALLAAVTVQGGEGEVGEAGRALLEKLEKQFSGRRVASEAEFVSLVQGVVETVTETVNLVAVWLDGEAAWVVGYGPARVVMRRAGQNGAVFTGKAGTWQAMQGSILPGDRILMGTQGLLGEMSEALVSDVLSFDEVTQAGEELTTQVHVAAGNSGVAGLIVHVKEVEEKQPAFVTPPRDYGEAKEVEEVQPAFVPQSRDYGEAKETQKVQEIEKEQQGKEELNKPTVYLKKEPVKQRKTAISVGIILLALLGLSVFFGWQRRQDQQMETVYRGIVEETQNLLNEAQGVAAADPAQAKALTDAAIQRVQQATTHYADKAAFQQKLQSLLAEIQSQAASISGEQQMGAVPVWFDLSLLREGMVGNQLGLYKDAVLVLDGQLGAVGEINRTSKQAEMAGGGDLVKGATLLNHSGARSAVFSPAGVIELNISNKTSGYLVKPEGDWQRIAGLGMFGGNVYLLDAGTSEIWRYPALDKGVGARQRWLGKGVTPDLSQAVEMVIDGDVWVGLKNGEVLRFRRGAPESFKMQGLSEPVGELAAIYTDEECEKVYILDRGKTRVVAFSKDGQYVKQYQWKGLAGVTDLAVAEGTGKMYLLSGSSVYEMSL
jgi:hypothetical protein